MVAQLFGITGVNPEDFCNDALFLQKKCLESIRLIKSLTTQEENEHSNSSGIEENEQKYERTGKQAKIIPFRTLFLDL